jgi:hypothetical protein
MTGREDTMCFSTYKLYLMHIDSTFRDVRMPWNKQYYKVGGKRNTMYCVSGYSGLSVSNV